MVSENNYQNYRSVEPSALDASVTALSDIWKQAFKQLHNQNTTEDDIESTAIAASELLKQVLRLTRESTTSVISREQLRHLNVEDDYSIRVGETQVMMREMHKTVIERLDKIDSTLSSITKWMESATEQLKDNARRIETLESEVKRIKEQLNA